MKLRRSVVVSLQFPAFHHWPKAPEESNFLRFRHRHLFKVRAWAEVEHNDRDIEFIALKDKIYAYIYEHYFNQDLGETSCESIAERLLYQFLELHTVEVLEDGENGAFLQRTDQ